MTEQAKTEMDSITTCGNCHSAMPLGLRFCRNCGYRLGEGTAEYTETVRFQNVAQGSLPVNNAHNPYAGAGGQMAAFSAGPLKKRKRRMSGMSWIFIGLLVFFIAAAGFTAILKPVQRGVTVGVVRSTTRSYAGVNSFDTTDGGVTFDNVDFPGSPADKAGLVGGDIITEFDGTHVESDDDIMDLLASTPIGKTVDVKYLRDGEEKTTKLTTISKAEYDRLNSEYRNRPIGVGRFGYDDSDAERVPIPNTKMFGVELKDVSPSLPADMAGIKNGDIVIEFGGIPIRTPEEFRFRVRSAIPYETVKVVIMRDGERLEIPVKMGRQG